MSSAISPLAPANQPVMPAIAGVRMAATEAGIKYKNRKDLTVLIFDEGTTVAGVFTRSRCPSAPVETCRLHLPHGEARALIVNSGNANAFTGKAGRQATAIEVDAMAAAIGAQPHTIFLSSTGVIGEPLNAQAFAHLLAPLAEAAKPDGWADAAAAIMTTDTFAKMATRTITIGGKPCTINGIAKGAGMIAPDMATMLSYIATDAAISANALQSIISHHVDNTFNAVSVDSDTSTSDTLLAFATGQAGNALIADNFSEGYETLSAAMAEVMHDLALQIVSDGEGISKRIKAIVKGAATGASARRIAKSIIDSPLIKTAVAGADANWGRVVMAVGKAGEPADRDRLEIAFGDITVALDGERVPDYSEQACAAYMQSDEIVITVDLKMGPGTATMWGCDLTAEYVAINADYRS